MHIQSLYSTVFLKKRLCFYQLLESIKTPVSAIKLLYSVFHSTYMYNPIFTDVAYAFPNLTFHINIWSTYR